MSDPLDAERRLDLDASVERTFVFFLLVVFEEAVKAGSMVTRRLPVTR
jgi:hypothetical protein